MKELQPILGGRAALMIDADNLGISAKESFGQPPDYSKIKALIAKRAELVHASAYLHKRESAEKFAEMLRYNGFLVRQRERKSDVDTFLLWDAIQLIPKVDVLVLGACDGDYVPLAWESRLHGTTLAVLSIDGSSSTELEANADLIIPVTDELLFGDSVAASSGSNGRKIGL